MYARFEWSFLLSVLAFWFSISNSFADNCISKNDSVVLSRQGQVDSFPILYPGCTGIRGKIIIKGDNITNLYRLNALTYIESLNIRENPNLSSLRGLSNLQSAGYIDISYNKSLLSLHGLEALDSVTTHLEIKYNLNLVTLDGLNSLEKVKGTLSVFSNASLQSLDGLESVESVTRLAIYGNPELTTLAGIDSMLKLRYIDIWFNDNLSCCSLVNNIKINNPSVLLNNIFSNNTGCSSAAEIVNAPGGQLCCKTDFTVNSRIICAGESIVVGGHIYNIPGLYVDSFLTTTGCDSIVFTELAIGQKSLTVTEKALCNGQQLLLSNGRVITAAGIYRDTIPFTCDSVIEYRVTFLDNTQIIRESAVCEGGSYTLPGGKVVTAAGVYADTVRNAAGCDSIFVTTLTFFPNTFIVSLSAEDTVPSGDSIVLVPLYANGTAVSWSWQPGNGLNCTDCGQPTATPMQNTIYTVKARAENGCEDTASIQLIVPVSDIYVPTAFTPNGDRINDELEVFVAPSQVFFLKIYNRYGELVFQSNDGNIKWNGICATKNCPVDTYIYIIDVTLYSGQTLHKQGTVLLLR